MPGIVAVRWVAGGALALVCALRSRRVVNGLQVLIAKGRRTRRRGALEGRYAPVRDEVFAADCEVVSGALPEALDGVFLRVGSNPYYEPYASYHWFEGDGMVHATRIRGGKASYCNRFVRTHRLQAEQRAGFPIYAKFGDQEGLRGVFVALLELWKQKVGIIRGAPVAQLGTGTANTNVVYHAGRLLALHEGDLPHQLRVLCEGVVETVGRLRCGDWAVPFTAHPKKDAATGNLHIIGYQIDRAPYLTYGLLGPDGALLKRLELPVEYASMYHDFAVTENYVVVFQMPLIFDPKIMVEKNSLPVAFRPELPAKIGLLPITATRGDEIVWYELPSFYVFHFANAWEDADGLVRVFGCRLNTVDLGASRFSEELGARMTEFVVDPKPSSASGKGGKTAGVAVRRLSEVCGDFPIVHPDLQGRRSRWCYQAATDVASATGEFLGVSKVDLLAPAGTKEAAVATVEHPRGMRGGECFFVPRVPGAPVTADSEDDGFLLTYATEAPDSATSSLLVYDAKTMALAAEVRLPQRVPHGFHAGWMTAAQIRAQRLPGLELQ